MDLTINCYGKSFSAGLCEVTSMDWPSIWRVQLHRLLPAIKVTYVLHVSLPEQDTNRKGRVYKNATKMLCKRTSDSLTYSGLAWKKELRLLTANIVELQSSIFRFFSSVSRLGWEVFHQLICLIYFPQQPRASDAIVILPWLLSKRIMTLPAVDTASSMARPTVKPTEPTQPATKQERGHLVKNRASKRAKKNWA